MEWMAHDVHLPLLHPLSAGVAFSAVFTYPRREDSCNCEDSGQIKRVERSLVEYHYFGRPSFCPTWPLRLGNYSNFTSSFRVCISFAPYFPRSGEIGVGFVDWFGMGSMGFRVGVFLNGEINGWEVLLLKCREGEGGCNV